MELAAIIGFLLGPPARTLVDFGFKALEDPEIVFDRIYWITMCLSLMITFLMAVAEASIKLVNLPPGSLGFIFLFAFGQGFMINHFVNKPIDLYLCKKAAR